jgi:hypothetical protein
MMLARPEGRGLVRERCATAGEAPGGLGCPGEHKVVLLLSMPFAGIAIPSIQLPVLAGYLEQRGITVHTKHLYLQASSIYGVQNYNALISPPNDSYTAQLGFSKFLFPEHWEKTIGITNTPRKAVNIEPLTGHYFELEGQRIEVIPEVMGDLKLHREYSLNLNAYTNRLGRNFL